jgi:hypothetical protein
MGWEQRGKQKYLYRSRWENGRVVREYVGSGAEAEAAAKRDEAERTERAEIKRIGVILDALRIVIDVLIEDQMIAAGYHRHDRGRWRKKRVTARATSNCKHSGSS